MNRLDNGACIAKLTKDYTNHRGKVFKAGTNLPCSLKLYTDLVKSGHVKPDKDK